MTNAEGQQQLEERQRQEEEERLGLEAQAAQDKINHYGETMIRADQERAHGNHPKGTGYDYHRIRVGGSDNQPIYEQVRK